MKRYHALLALVLGVLAARATDGQVYRWTDGDVIPGTEDLIIRRGVDLSGLALQYANLNAIDLSHVDFRDADLQYAVMSETILTEADFSGAVVTGIWLADVTSRGFSAEQFYSTSSYESRHLQEVSLIGNDLSGWDFRKQDLTDATFNNSSLANVDFTGATLTRARLGPSNDLTGADFTDAIIEEAAFTRATAAGFVPEQLYVTASYQNHELHGIGMWMNNLEAWDLHDQDLRYANLRGTQLSGADLRGADLRSANFESSQEFSAALVDDRTVYDQWTLFPAGFNLDGFPATLVRTRVGDFNVDDRVDAVDLDLLSRRLRRECEFCEVFRSWLDNRAFDLNEDELVDLQDLDVWVREARGTYFGDANLDGEFNSGDLIQVFQSAEYESDSASDSSWSTGDWNADGRFSSEDLTKAFQDGGYEKGPRTAISAVPEPASLRLLVIGSMLLRRRRFTKR